MLLGLLGGTFCGPSPIAPAERGGYKVVEADFHVHSHAGDGLLSPFGLLAHTSSERATKLRDFYQRGKADSPELAAVGSSDYHWFNSLGMCRTYVFVRNNEQQEILEALQKGRTVVYDVEGNAFGDAELMQLLQEQPIKRDSVDYRYRGSGTIDVLTRTCGWLGLAGLLFFRRRKRVLS